ncbi:MAG: glycosyltransferase family 2 protein [Flavobacteriales bacterium]|jgi:GT2 family glycosyltransferase|nr:glycosyltransferase family 2 protein [Flavobacteriales bacterium]
MEIHKKVENNPKETAVVILNYNGKHWFEKFLENVIKHSPQADIWVIDNASTDDSVAYLEEKYPHIPLVILDQNFGFAGGYNEGLKQIKGYPYWVLLNSDIEVSKDWLIDPIELLKSDEKIAACQPKILAYDQKTHFEHAGAAGGFIDRYGYAFCRGRVVNDREEDLGQYDDQIQIFWATGAAFFIKSELYTKHQGFDETYFAHFEEIDLCWRLQNDGYEIHYAPNATVYHVGGGTLSIGSPRKTFLNFKNSLAMLYKNLPKNKILTTIFTHLLFDGMIGIQFLLHGKPKHCWAIVRAHFAFYKMIKDLKTKRTNIKTLPKMMFKGSMILDFLLKKHRTYNQIMKNT